MKFDIGGKIKSIRKSRGMRAVDLAEKLGVSKAYISKVESNKTGVSFDTLEKICSVIGVTLSEFFSDELSPADLRLLKSAKGLSTAKKRQLAEFMDGLTDNKQ